MRLPLYFVVIAIGWSSFSGCSTFKDYYNQRSNALNEYHDDYKVAGEEGRAEMVRQKETDGLTPLLQSPEARAIEKNLGID
jgi:hypothetical protein